MELWWLFGWSESNNGLGIRVLAWGIMRSWGDRGVEGGLVMIVCLLSGGHSFPVEQNGGRSHDDVTCPWHPEASPESATKHNHGVQDAHWQHEVRHLISASNPDQGPSIWFRQTLGGISPPPSTHTYFAHPLYKFSWKLDAYIGTLDVGLGHFSPGIFPRGVPRDERIWIGEAILC